MQCTFEVCLNVFAVTEYSMCMRVSTITRNDKPYYVFVRFSAKIILHLSHFRLIIDRLVIPLVR